MKHLFVPYNIALIAKEKGFNDPCLCYINSNNILDNDNSSLSYGFINCPIYQQIIDWFREKHGIHISTRPKDRFVSLTPDIYWEYALFSTKDGAHLIPHSDETKTYHECMDLAIIEAFKLI